MAHALYSDTSISVSRLVEDIELGEIALPELQRPVVWSPAQVRDLLDSMYKGFPVGSLLFWSTGAEQGARQIGADEKKRAARYLIVDGQQRLTALYAVRHARPAGASGSAGAGRPPTVPPAART
ncbi:DUF262 domain-containing protein [Embleya sp. NPDC008237]|uniref:DUF262 domain-containing protein n=1 Tax=Embleya sp. NPDC008237 TaxID=3363978 RepID=UPI0036E1A58D